MAIVQVEDPSALGRLGSLGIGKNEKLLLGAALAFGGGYFASQSLLGASAGSTAASQALTAGGTPTDVVAASITAATPKAKAAPRRAPLSDGAKLAIGGAGAALLSLVGLKAAGII